MNKYSILILASIAILILAVQIISAVPQIPFTSQTVYIDNALVNSSAVIGQAAYGTNPPPDYMCALIVNSNHTGLKVETYTWSTTIFDDIPPGIWMLYTVNGTWYLYSIVNTTVYNTSTVQIYSPNINPTNIVAYVNGSIYAFTCTSYSDIQSKIDLVKYGTIIYVNGTGNATITDTAGPTVTITSGTTLFIDIHDATAETPVTVNYTTGAYYLVIYGTHAYIEDGKTEYYDLPIFNPLPISQLTIVKPKYTVFGDGVVWARSHTGDTDIIYIPPHVSAYVETNASNIPTINLIYNYTQRYITLNQTLFQAYNHITLVGCNKILYNSEILPSTATLTINTTCDDGLAIVLRYPIPYASYFSPVSSSDECSYYAVTQMGHIGVVQAFVNRTIPLTLGSITINNPPDSTYTVTGNTVAIYINNTITSNVDIQIAESTLFSPSVSDIIFNITAEVSGLNATFIVTDAITNKVIYTYSTNLTIGENIITLRPDINCVDGINITPFSNILIKLGGTASLSGNVYIKARQHVYIIFPELSVTTYSNNNTVDVIANMAFTNLMTDNIILYTPEWLNIEGIDLSPVPSLRGSGQLTYNGSANGYKRYVLTLYQAPSVIISGNTTNTLYNTSIDVIKIFVGAILNITTPVNATVSVLSHEYVMFYNATASVPTFIPELPGVYVVSVSTVTNSEFGIASYIVEADPLIIRIMHPPRILHLHVNGHEINETEIQCRVGKNNFTLTDPYGRPLYNLTVVFTPDDNGSLIPLSFSYVNTIDYKKMNRTVVSPIYANMSFIHAGVAVSVTPVSPTVVVIMNDTADTLVCDGACINVTRVDNSTFIVNVTGAALIWDAYYVNITMKDIYGHTIHATVMFNGTSISDIARAGNYTVELMNTTEGFVPKTPKMTLTVNHTLMLNFTYKVPLKLKDIKVSGGEITGRVEDYYGNAISGITVKLVDKYGKTISETKSGSDGTFKLTYSGDITGATIVAEGNDDYVATTESIAGVQSTVEWPAWIAIVLVLILLLALVYIYRNTRKHSVYLYESKYIE